MDIKIKKLTDTATIPTRGTKDSAGLDLYADIDETIEIPAHSVRKIPTGIAMEIPKGYFGGLYARSGMATENGLRPSTGTSVIDADYRGDIIVALRNDTAYAQQVFPQDRIAQLVIQPFLYCDLQESDTLSETERGNGGFGSTN